MKIKKKVTIYNRYRQTDGSRYSDMKTVSELGISPAPWRASVNDLGMGFVHDNNGGWELVHAHKYPYNEKVIEPNLILMASAPNLYENLIEARKVLLNIKTDYVNNIKIGEILDKIDRALIDAGGWKPENEKLKKEIKQ